MSLVCNMDCLNCKYDDCINDCDMTLSEREFSDAFNKDIQNERDLKVEVGIGMQRYVHNRPDREAYIKARNREYYMTKKLKHDMKAISREKYLRHREEKIEYQKSYYRKNKDEILAIQKSKYDENKEEINRKRREQYAISHPRKPKQTDEERREKQREYREKNREELNRKKREAYHRKKLLESQKSV